MQTILKKLREQEIISDLDVHFAELMATLSHDQNDELLLGVALISYATTQGHICVDLSRYADRVFPAFTGENQEIPRCPPLDLWLNVLTHCKVVGQPGDYAPLILDKQRLYLYRYWQYEQLLATNIIERVNKSCLDIDINLLQRNIQSFFPTLQNSQDGQKIAIFKAMFHPFCVISGGPGTGKTSTVIKIIVLLLEQNPFLRIVLAAPTGKAATRLQETILVAKNTLNCSLAVRTAIPQETYTIHRLLGSLPYSPYFRHHSQNYLRYDVVIVDEASMIDLALMTKLAQAIPPTTRWILLGDKDQLVSVEAGTVLGDICAIAENTESSSKFLEKFNEKELMIEESTFKTHPLSDCIVFLEKNYRFDQNSGIGQLAQFVKQGQSDSAIRLLKSGNYQDIHFHPLTDLTSTELIDQVKIGFADYLKKLKKNDPKEILAVFNQFRVLCALRQGQYGVVTLNGLIEKLLGIKKYTHYRWYHGQPIMITHNDYTLKLFNGDIGIILWNPPKHQELCAFFLSPDGHLRTFWLNRLPEYELAYAMTIHKSQGSEFDKILVLLPQPSSPILTRELIYTAITRARQDTCIWGHEQVLKEAIQRKIQRTSGLQDILRNG
ncbi:MAG: exodeoxyribonuclease V subunit alpha [Beggiatoa sp. IS2]|nr:MAG: exodeoxyribonuclease V subunit alpha [Beggiatoa sp. IS2]